MIEELSRDLAARQNVPLAAARYQVVKAFYKVQESIAADIEESLAADVEKQIADRAIPPLLTRERITAALVLRLIKSIKR